jgi:hypothetical protein
MERGGFNMNRRSCFFDPNVLRTPNVFQTLTLCAAAALALALAVPIVAQTRPEAPKGPSAAPAKQTSIETTASSVKDAAETQAQLMMLLRLSPTLTSAVAHDPSLLADQQYVARNNPELAQFLAKHPDIARNPEFYLFSHLNQGGGSRDQALERAVWPELAPQQYKPSEAAHVVENIIPIIVLPAFFIAVIWIVRIFVESRRWNRAFKQQSEIHARLIDKLGTSQDLVAYMETEAGKRFLTASPILLGSETGQRMPNAVARVLTPLQAGIVMTLLGIGLFFLRHAGPDMETGMTVLGTILLMPGIGFILSAAATWVLAHRLGLMPEKPAAQIEAAPPFGPKGRQ